jgi:hypothetical protein
VTASTVAVTLLWIAVFAQVPSQWHSPTRLAVWGTMLLLAAIGTLDLTAIGARLDAAFGLPNLADLTQHVLAIITTTLARYCAVAIFGTAKQRARWSAVRSSAVAACTIGALIGLFAVSPARTRPTNAALYADFPMQYAAHPAVIAYWAIFAAYLGTTFVIIARLAGRYGRTAGRSPLGSGLQLLAAGMVAGLTYLGYGTSVVVARAVGVQGPFIRTAPGVIQALFGALIVLVAAGGVLPATQHWPLVRQAGFYRSLRLLYPLWKGLCQAVPGIALDPVPAWADRLDPRDLRMRLYRRVIEIRDGYMALCPVDVPGIEETVRAAAGRRRLSPADEATVTAATRLELARRAELRGEVRAGTGVPHADKEFTAGTDLDSEVRLLRVVAVHWPTIRRAAESIERGVSPAHAGLGASPAHAGRSRPAQVGPNRP